MKATLTKLYQQHLATILQFMKFGTVGAAGFCVDCFLTIKVGTNLLGLGPVVAGIASFPFTVTFTWLGNRLFTFRGEHSGSAHAQLMRFLVVCAGGFVLNRGAYIIVVTVLPRLIVFAPPYDAAYQIMGLLAGTAAGMFFNFFFARKLVFN